jgi:hypothetical protein
VTRWVDQRGSISLFPETNDLVIGRLDRALRDALPRSDEQLTTGNTSP